MAGQNYLENIVYSKHALWTTSSKLFTVLEDVDGLY